MKTYVIATLLLLTMFEHVSAQEKFELILGDERVSYSELKLFDDNGDSVPDKWSYRLNTGGGTEIVASGYDTSNDENVDLWLVYKQERLFLEAYDTNKDGNADVFFEFNKDEDIIKEYGDGLERLTRRDVTEPFIVSEEEIDVDALVGDLSDIDDLYTKGSSSFFIYLIILIVIVVLGGVYYKKFYTKNREGIEEKITE